MHPVFFSFLAVITLYVDVEQLITDVNLFVVGTGL